MDSIYIANERVTMARYREEEVLGEVQGEFLGHDSHRLRGKLGSLEHSFYNDLC